MGLVSKKTKFHDNADGDMDIISNLPRSIIDCIMNRISLTDAARMSVVSRKWHLSWQSIPQIVIDDDFCHHFNRGYSHRDASYRLSDTVSKLLLDHLGSVVKFSLDVTSMGGFPDINHWLRFLAKNDVKELSLKFDKGSEVLLNSNLFSCVKLESLSIQGCILEGASFGKLRKLSSLLVSNVDFREPTFDDLISCCPLLENLTVIDCESINSNFEFATLVTPRVRHLVMSDNFLNVENVDYLSSVSLTFNHKPIYQPPNTPAKKLFKALTNAIKLEKMCLGSHAYKFLIMENQYFKTFVQIRILELKNIHLLKSDDFHTLIRTIQIFPYIESLNISVSHTYFLTSDDVQMLQHYDPDITLGFLRRANVKIRIGSKLDLKLIEFLLAYATKLETMSFSFTTCAREGDEIKMLRPLIQFRRASPNVVFTGLDALIVKNSNGRREFDFFFKDYLRGIL